MANLFQAIDNFHKYGIKNALQGAQSNPGGFLGQGGVIGPGGAFDTGAGGAFSNAPADPNQVYLPASFGGGTLPMLGSLNESSTTAPANTTPYGPDSSYANQPNLFQQATSAVQTPGVTSSSATQPKLVVINGIAYDVTDPAQRNAYINAAYSVYADQQRQALGQAANTSAESLASLRNNAANLDTQYGDFQRSNKNNVDTLNQNFDLGSVNRGNYFAGISPNAFQSSQLSGEQFANDQRLKGLGDLALGATRTQQNYDQGRAQNQQQQTDLSNSYDQYVQNAQTGINQYRDQLATSVIGAGGGSAANLPGVQSFNPGTAPAQQGLQAVNTDISQYTPYLNFNALSASPTANYFSNPQVTKTQQSPLDQYLGYPVGQNDKNYLQSYLGG